MMLIWFERMYLSAEKFVKLRKWRFAVSGKNREYR